ncbi:hypothetical protein Tco_0637745 [Tanacetum coccineum]
MIFKTLPYVDRPGWEEFIFDTELFTHNIERTKTYEDYESELYNEVGEPWSKDGVPYEICDHICEPFCFKNGKTKWPTCNSNEDGFRNGGELPGMVQVGYMTYFQDYEWYDELTDSSLKEEALKQKAIYEKSWGDASQSVTNFCAWLKTCFGNFHELDYELLVKLQDYWWKDEVEQEDNERCKLIDDREPPICEIRMFKMIKYSFGQEEEYVAIKEYEYSDLTRTNDDACHAYREIFHNMDEGWLVTRAEFLHTAYPGPRWKEIDNVGEVSIIWNPMCVVVMLEFRRIYNTHSCSYTQLGKSYRANIRGVSR